VTGVDRRECKGVEFVFGLKSFEDGSGKGRRREV
jgi:hypothetical protein